MSDLSMSGSKTKVTVWVVLILMFAFAFYWFLIKPQFTQIDSLKKQITAKEQKLATLLLAQEREKELLKENKMMQDRIAQLQKILPVSSDEFLFGEEFQVAAKLCGVNIDSLVFNKMSKKGVPQNSLPFVIRISTKKLDNIKYFIIHTETFPQIININKFVLQKGTLNNFGMGSSKGALYSADIEGIIYLSQRK